MSLKKYYLKVDEDREKSKDTEAKHCCFLHILRGNRGIYNAVLTILLDYVLTHDDNVEMTNLLKC